MAARPRFHCVVGTRPEVIKMAPVIARLREADWAETRVLATGQHDDLLEQTLAAFRIEPEIRLDVMKEGQTLAGLTARLLTALDPVLAEQGPGCILVQGDTTTVMATTLGAFYRRIPVGHVEAGLRTGDPAHPFPEEMNRALAARIASHHFCPTPGARENLLREGIPAESIRVTGNTAIDALSMCPEPEGEAPGAGDARLIFVTLHRRELFGARARGVLRALGELARSRDDVEILFPVHPNPEIRGVAHRELEDAPRVRLCEPLDYARFVQAMRRAYLIVSDSGGVQEEAPSLGTPVLVVREATERPEAVALGASRVVGTDPERLLAAIRELLDDAERYAAMARPVRPYGDGRAAERIVDHLQRCYAPGTVAAPPLEDFRPPTPPAGSARG